MVIRPESKTNEMQDFCMLSTDYTDDTKLFIHLAHKNVTQSFEGLKWCLDDCETRGSEVSQKAGCARRKQG